ncbi:lipid A export ATP-binding/permease protein MsbA [Abditibacteriota bacterium]|nr:lipid A export ATP-binding/permease protein MsbA [Abditibacteriota bacterium]
MENLKRLWPYVRAQRSSLLLGILCTALSGLFNGLFLWLSKEVLSPVVDKQAQVASDAQRQSRLDLMVVIILVVAVGRLAADAGKIYILQRTGQRILARLRESLFGHLSTLSINFFERKRTGEVMSRLTNDIGALQTVLTTAVVSFIAAPIDLAISVGLMLYWNWRLTLFVVVLLPPIAFAITRAGKKIKEAVKDLTDKNAQLTDYLQEKIAAMRLIQTFGTNRYEVGQFQAVNTRSYRATMSPIRIQSTLAPMIELIGMSGIVIALWFGSRDIIAGRMEAAALLSFLLAIHRTAMNAKAMANLNLLISSADAAAARIFEFFDEQPQIKDAPEAIDLATRNVGGHLRFERVRFSYPGDDREVLRDISFEIKPGQVVALAGLSGSGKTTIASLLPRLYDPTGGRITLDGLDLRDVSLQSLRDLIGAVPQDTTLFHGTLRDNIAYGSEGATLDQIVAAARRAHADEFIRTLPEAYDAPVGERGHGFSGGQKQRLAIARALLRNPKLLILDEATSALDAESEGLVQDALAELMKGRTTLIIAHRFSTIVNADLILVMDQGQIIESGTHAQLLARQGQYWRLYQMQAFQNKRGEIEANEIPSQALSA